MRQPTNRVFVIAEAGVNHNGDAALAKRLIDGAIEAGADAVKFQTWRPGEITGRFTHKVDYLNESTEAAESRYEMSNRLALPYEVFRELQRYAEEVGIQFLSTPDGFESLAFLVGDLGIPIVKVGSSEVTHLPFLEAVGRTGRPVILSTGLSTLGEVEAALTSLRSGGATDVSLLHCTSEYPAPDTELNLRAMTTLREAFDVPVGLSDHSVGTEASVVAVALGASILEKHFTLNRDLPGPDHKASLDVAGLKALVTSVRRSEQMLGDGRKVPTRSELANKNGIRRGVVAVCAISAGTRLTSEMLTCKRPGGGIEPAQMGCLPGFTVNRDLMPDEPLQWSDLK